MYSLETCLVSGTGGGAPHFKGFSFLYHGFGLTSIEDSVTPDSTLVVVAYDLECSSGGRVLTILSNVVSFESLGSSCCSPAATGSAWFVLLESPIGSVG